MVDKVVAGVGPASSSNSPAAKKRKIEDDEPEAPTFFSFDDFQVGVPADSSGTDETEEVAVEEVLTLGADDPYRSLRLYNDDDPEQVPLYENHPTEWVPLHDSKTILVWPEAKAWKWAYNKQPQDYFLRTTQRHYRVESGVLREKQIEAREGVVSTWNADKGFGYIKPAEGDEDIFVHHNDLAVKGSKVNGFRKLSSGMKVTYVLSIDQQGRLCASSVNFAEPSLQGTTLRASVGDSTNAQQGGLPTLNEGDEDDEDSSSGEELDIFDGADCHYYTDIGVGYNENQDRCLEKTRLPSYIEDGAQYVMFGIFDGHNGSVCSEYVKQNLHKNIVSALSNIGKTDLKENDIRKCHKTAYKITDKNFMKQNASDISGSTAVTALLYGPDDEGDLNLYVTYVGDSFALLGRKNGEFQRLTIGHKPNNSEHPEEQERLKKAEAEIVTIRGVPRVCIQVGQATCGLAVSRAFGDSQFKGIKKGDEVRDFVTSVPDILRYKVDRRNDDFIILGTDGITDGLEDKEIVEIVRKERENAPKALAQAAKEGGSTDDRTVALCFLNF